MRLPALSLRRTATGSNPKPAAIPLRLSPGRFRLWGIGLAVMSGILVVGAPGNRWVDFPQYWYAAQMVGRLNLADPAAQAAWQHARGYFEFIFLYPPGTAWLYFPLGFLPLAAAFWIQAVAVGLMAVAIGFLASRVFDLDPRVALIGTLAWSPVLASAAVGQNAPLGLLLAMVALYALKTDRQLLAGVAVGAMLYKPTLALPLLILLLLRRQWTALFSVAPVAIGWYALGVAGSAGDWLWPRDWLAGTAPYFAADTWQNANKTIALPGLLMGHTVWPVLAYGAAIAVVVAALPRLLRAPIVEAGAAACLIGVVASPHSLQYEAVMALPILLWAAGGTGAGLAEPWRTRLLVAAYLIGQLYVFSPNLGFSVFVIVTFAATAIWISGWQRFGRAAQPEGMPEVAAAGAG